MVVLGHEGARRRVADTFLKAVRYTQKCRAGAVIAKRTLPLSVQNPLDARKIKYKIYLQQQAARVAARPDVSEVVLRATLS